jgi:hypothetical protein
MRLQMMPRVRLGLLLSVAAAFGAGLVTMWLFLSSARERAMTEPSPQGSQTLTVNSTDSRYRAAVVLPSLDGLGATISQPHQVWISASDGGSRLMLEADKTDGIHIQWKTAHQLEICYRDAQIHKFSNRFVDILRDGELPKVRMLEVVLRRVQRLDECSS